MKDCFRVEEVDIVLLESDREGNTTGWVNVGVHSLRIELVHGNLTVDAYSRTNERESHGSIFVTKSCAVRCGGVDPDAL